MINPPKSKYRHDYRAPEYLISNVDLSFDLDAKKTTVTAVTKMTRHCTTTVPLRLDGEDLTLVSLQVNNQTWANYKKDGNQLLIGGLPDSFTLQIVNEISPANNTVLEGLYQSGKTLCTQCEAEGFRRITWYLDRPDVMARFTTKIIANKARYPLLLSNGNCLEEGDLEDGRHWVRWEDPFPKPCYLFALVAGDFDVLCDTFTSRSGRKITLKIFVERGKLNRTSWAMAALINSMKWDEERFGLEYDLDIYMVVAVDFFNMGAMENKGLNIFNSRYVLVRTDTATDKDYLDIERVIGHEYFHNWTGNRVTCRDWFQLTLKEGLTVFRDQEFSSDLGSRVINRINNVRTIRSLQFAEDAGPMSHPIRPDQVIEINNFYTLTVYEKGAEVIRMIHTILGEENFQKGMKRYFELYDGKAVTCEDFVQVMEEAANIDLSYFRRWYSQAGTPIVTVKDNYNSTDGQYTLIVTQHTPPTAGQEDKLPLHIPFSIELYDKEGRIIPLQRKRRAVHHVLNVIHSEQTFIFDNIHSRPIPSLLCNFSAPVKLEYKWNDQDLIFLMHHAENDFSRWDASQHLMERYIKLNVSNYQQGQALFIPNHVINAFRTILLNESIDPGLLAEILTLPSTTEMAELFDVIDPIAIGAVHGSLTRLLADALADEFLSIYNAKKLRPYCGSYSTMDIGKRSLRNTCLHYLAFGESEEADHLVSKQYYFSSNMSEVLAALSSSVAAELPCQEALLKNYEDKWHQDGLVMDKWFYLQGTSTSPRVLKKVRSLLNHRSFNIKNPNRVYSLIGSFACSNPAAFHAADGSGYRFITEILIKLNSLNPQVASRLVESLIYLKRYDMKRQRMMRSTLEQLKELENLSWDLYEKITKALL